MQKAIDVEVVQRLWAEKFSEGARDQQRQASHH